MKEEPIYEIDGLEYFLLKQIQKDNETYYYFSNVDVEDDYLIRKQDKDNPDYMIPIKDEEELKKALLYLTDNELEYLSEATE